MSAFVIGKDTMDRAVAAICGTDKYYRSVVLLLDGTPTNQSDSPTTIGRRLFAMNIEAVTQRYDDCREDPNNLPGPCDAEGGSTVVNMATEYQFGGETLNKRSGKAKWTAALKSLVCLHYQCSEGDVVETSLFKELDRAIRQIAVDIVSNTPEYQKAEWG